VHWFKIVLLVALGLSAISNLRSVGRMRRATTPREYAAAAIVGVLLLMGILVYL